MKLKTYWTIVTFGSDFNYFNNLNMRLDQLFMYEYSISVSLSSVWRWKYVML